MTPTVLLLFIPMGDSFFCPSYAGFHPCRLQKQGMATACCELAYEGLGGVARNNGKQEKWQVEELPLTSLKINMSPGPFQKRT